MTLEKLDAIADEFFSKVSETPWATTRTLSAPQIRETRFVLPTVQRGYVWTTGQRIEFLTRVIRGLPLGAFLTVRKGDDILLLDGQQRATSLGASVVNLLGQAVKLPPLYFDVDAFLAGGHGPCWLMVPKPGRIMIEVADIFGRDFNKSIRKIAINPQEDVSRDDFRDAYAAYSLSMMRTTNVTAAFMEISGEADEEYIRRAFQSWNSGGTPIDDETLAALMAK